MLGNKIINNIDIVGIVSGLPKQKIINDDFNTKLSRQEIEKLFNATGIHTRYHTKKNEKTSDLCIAAAEHLIKNINWDKKSIDGIIFLTQTPDKKLPGSAFRIQKALGLTDNTFAFDINLGCSAYPYGLWIAGSLMQTGAKRVLILAGDTISKLINKDDRGTSFLFGDAGSATAIDVSKENKWEFILGSDGSGYESIKADFKDSLVMEGSKVFEFALSRIPPLIKRIDNDNFKKHDLYFFHQANKFMLSYLKRKCKIADNSFPININKYGNTSSASIPLLMTDYFQKNLINKNLRIALIGFGVGFSWAAASLELRPECFFDTIFLE